ncbi:MarR family transcriptional regulator [bacterium]|nr:MarR family transcriptional regulator [bacterium]
MFKANEITSHHTDSIFYEIELTAKYCKKLGNQVFEHFITELNLEEFVILDTLLCNPEICQRDIAKIILRDRANTGKLLDNLEKKRLIERNLTLRNNRPVKIVKLTETGYKKVIEATNTLQPHKRLVEEKLKKNDLAKLSLMLKKLRNVLNETVELQI